MRYPTVATLALGLLLFACSDRSGSSGPVIETTSYPGGDTPPRGGPPQQDSAAAPISPPMLLCPGDDSPDGCAAGGGSDASGDADEGATDVASPDAGDGEAGIVCPPLDTIACGMPLHEPQAPCPTYGDVRTWCAQGAATSELIDPCDGLLNVSVVEGIDSSAIYYFDYGTKELVGVAIEGNNGGPFCVGGVPGFNAAQAFSPNCPSETTISFDDAGVCATLPGLDASAE